MVSLVLKPLIPTLNVIPDLLAVLTFPQNVILINYSRGFCSPPMRSSATWALSIHLCGKTLVILSPPTPAKRRCPGLKIIFSFLLLISFCTALNIHWKGWGWSWGSSNFGHLMQRADSQGKNPDAGKDWGQEKKGAAEDEMIRQHHRLSGHESEQTLGDIRGQRSLGCCSPWGRKESDRT